MLVKIFGKKECSACKDTMRKFETFLGRWGVNEGAELQFHDMDTVDGMAEGAFNSVMKIPTTIIENKSGEFIARWDGKVPLSQEFQKYFEELKPTSEKDIN